MTTIRHEMPAATHGAPLQTDARRGKPSERARDEWPGFWRRDCFFALSLGPAGPLPACAWLALPRLLRPGGRK